MQKENIGLTLGILILIFIGIASALYSGETITFDLDFEIVNCSIINNIYNLEGLNLSWNNTNFTISTSQYYKSDNLTISCWVIKYGESEEVIVSSGSRKSSGGGSGFNPDWNKTVINETETVGGGKATELIEPELKEEIEDKSILKIIIFLSVIFIVLIICLIKILRKKEKPLEK